MLVRCFVVFVLVLVIGLVLVSPLLMLVYSADLFGVVMALVEGFPMPVWIFPVVVPVLLLALVPVLAVLGLALVADLPVPVLAVLALAFVAGLPVLGLALVAVLPSWRVPSFGGMMWTYLVVVDFVSGSMRCWKGRLLLCCVSAAGCGWEMVGCWSPGSVPVGFVVHYVRVLGVVMESGSQQVVFYNQPVV
jgi:hypothetical protein